MNAVSEVPENSTFIQEMDAGSDARERLGLRKAAVMARKFVIRMLLLGILVMLMSVSALAYYGYTTRTTGYVSDDRQCKWSVGDIELTGTRTYSYPFQEYFGFRFIDTKTIDEQTKLDVNGNPVQIVGLGGEKDWGINIGMGEKGKQILKPADTYVFLSGKAFSVVKYKSFCK